MADDEQEDATQNIRVAVRCRPLSKKELGNNEESIFSMDSGNVCLKGPEGQVQKFNFDGIFPPGCAQTEIWDWLGQPLLDKCIEGFNGTVSASRPLITIAVVILCCLCKSLAKWASQTVLAKLLAQAVSFQRDKPFSHRLTSSRLAFHFKVFAYGQTGSGKTWSMQGVPGDDELRGLIPRFTIKLFERIQEEKAKDENKLFLITCSYFEIYNEVISDLLDPSTKKKSSGLDVKEHPVLGVYVKGLQEIVTEEHKKMQKLIDQGMSNRHVAATKMNAESSRSHSVFTIKIHQKDKTDDSKSTFAKVNLVDLAGSERCDAGHASASFLRLPSDEPALMPQFYSI